MGKIDLAKIKQVHDIFSIGFGVIGWKSFGDLNGLLLSNTNSVHTFFVRFPLDLVFLNRDMRVIKLVSNLRPFRISPIVWQAKYVLEMPNGSIKKKFLKIGEEINLV